MAYQTDATQAAIVAALRAAGCSVCHIASATGQAGIPDLLVGRRSVNYLLEVKVRVGKRNPRSASLSPGQVEWHRNWRGAPVWIVTTPEEALRAVGVRI